MVGIGPSFGATGEGTRVVSVGTFGDSPAPWTHPYLNLVTPVHCSFFGYYSQSLSEPT